MVATAALNPDEVGGGEHLPGVRGRIRARCHRAQELGHSGSGVQEEADMALGLSAPEGILESGHRGRGVVAVVAGGGEQHEDLDRAPDP